MQSKTTERIRYLVLTALFIALMAVGARITIPLPLLSFTLQTLFVMMAGNILPPKYCLLTMILYAFFGLIGLPVFNNGGGFGYVLKPSFGFILGFIVGAFIISFVRKKLKTTFLNIFIADLIGIIIIYIIGLPYFYILANYILSKPIGIKTLLLYCFVYTIFGDIVKAITASFLTYRLKNFIK